MQKFSTLLLLLLFSLGSFVQAQDFDETDRLITFHIFNGERPLADSLLDLQIKQFPENPKYYLLKCQNYFYSRYFNPGNFGGDSLMQMVYQNAQKAIEVGEKDQLSLDEKYYMGSAYGYVARYLGRQAEYWDAYNAASTARDYLFDVLDEDPSYTDAKQELAIQQYFAGTRSLYIQFLAWFVGMGSDRTEALEEFHDVAESGELSKAEAQFVTFALYRFLENDFEQAEVIGTAFLETHPNNVFVRTQMSQMHFLNLVAEKGIDFLETEFDSLRTKYAITNPNILNQLGYNFLGQGRFDEATKILETNLRLYPDLANSYDSLSEAYELSGNVELAIKNAKICLEKLPYDSTITDNFRQLIREGSETRLENLGADVGKVNI